MSHTRKLIGVCVLLLLASQPSRQAYGQTYSYSVLMDTEVDLHGKDLTWVGRPAINASDTVAASVEFAGGSGVFTSSAALIQTGDTLSGQTVNGVGLGAHKDFNNTEEVAAFAIMNSQASIVSRTRIIGQHFGPTVCGLELYYSLGNPYGNNVGDVLFPSGITTMSGPSQAVLKVKASDSSCVDFVQHGDVVDGEVITSFEGTDADINDSGDWIKSVTYSGGQGIMFVDAQAGHSKHLVQRTGDIVAGRTIANFFRAFLSNAGEILYMATFTDGSEGIVSIGGPTPRGLLVKTGDVVGCREIETFVTSATQSLRMNAAGTTVFIAKLTGGPAEYGAFTLTSRIAATGDVVAGASVQSVNNFALGESGAVALDLSFPASRKVIALATPAGPAAACCGNGQPDPGEQCDDTNGNNNDACTNTCQNAVCGDGILGPGDGCDDGNASDDDGCSSGCAVESGWSCVGEPSVCSMLCGNGVVDSGEDCDLGPSSPDSGNCPEDASPPTCSACTRSCSSTCQLVGRCTAGGQECCTSTADCMTGTCCGNGTIESPEICDDGNLLGGDTCTPQCTMGTDLPITCCPRGSEVAGSTVATNRKLKLTRLDKAVGEQRFNSPGETVLLPGQRIHPCTESFTYCLESDAGILYPSPAATPYPGPALPGSAFGPRPPCRDMDGRVRAIFKDKKPYAVSDPDGLKKVQIKNNASQPNKFKHQVQGQNVNLSTAIGATRLRQTLVVGDTCMTSVLTCDNGTKTKKCTPTP